MDFFCDISNDVWRVKSDGTSLTQITACGGMFHPCTNPSGNYVLIEQLAPSPFNAQTIVLDANGIFIDTLADKYVSKTWINDTLIFYVYPVLTGGNIWEVMSYPNENIFATGAFPTQTELIGSIGDNKILFSDGYSHFVYDMQNFSQTVLKEYCGYRYSYEAFSYSPLSDKILVERQKIKLVDTISHTYFIQRDIILMNADGFNEQTIALPQN